MVVSRFAGASQLSQSESRHSSFEQVPGMRIGVFGNQDSWYVSELCREGQKRGHLMLPLRFEQCHSHSTTAGISLHCGDHHLRDFETLLIRTMPPGTLEQVVTRMDQLAGVEAQGVRVLNPPRSLECAVDKYLTTQRMALSGLPVPRTVICEDAETALAAFEQLGRDVIVKPLFGSEGRGIMRVSDSELALRAFRTLERLGAVIYQQEFVSGPGFDLRILLLDQQLIGSMKRTPKDGDFRANISQQGTGIAHTPTDREMHLAIAAARVTGCIFAGVDLMYDHRDEPLVIEVNAVPGWRGLQNACQINVLEKLFQWIESTAPDPVRDLR
jgi:ribosomal protein S6--L-glutamate ligase